MEVLSCADDDHAGESDDKVSETAMELETEHVRADVNFDGISNLGIYHEVKDDDSHVVLDNFLPSEGCSNGETFYGLELDGQNLSCYSHDSDEDVEKANADNFPGHDFAMKNEDATEDTVESEVAANSSISNLSHSQINTIETDASQAVWVKWRGKWQSGIRCARADWPLSTLRAKPTHDRKQYLVIFFPHTRNYSWADVLLIRPISESPQPIEYSSHVDGAKMANDLSVAHRFIMQKLTVGMLNVLDQLNREALVETARDVNILKDFALEASHCKEYTELGGMLLRLQNMILPRFLNSGWLQNSVESWKQQCQNANTAECVELLKEELTSSILWNEVTVVSNEAAQVDPGSDWKSWKQETMKWFSFSHPVTNTVGSEKSTSESLSASGNQIARKRPKLEVRRADTHAHGSLQSCSVEAELGFIKEDDIGNAVSFESGTPKKEIGPGPSAVAGVPDKWNDLVVEADNVSKDKVKDVELTPKSFANPKLSELGNHNRQCVAFIEAKGRQCVRFASEGEVYCCVHLASRSRENSAKLGAVHHHDSPMCEGTTVLGTKCKHRALFGSAFCKKHGPHDGKIVMPSVHGIKRKTEDTEFKSDSRSFTKHVISGEHGSPPFVDQFSSNKEQQIGVNDKGAFCIGSLPQGGAEACLETPIRHSLYCEKHIPNWLKRARNGKSRIISKEVFLDLLGNCHSRDQKLQLHQACELFYRLFKSILSLRNPVPKEVQFQWAIAEASKDKRTGHLLMKLVCREKERLRMLWGFGDDQNSLAPSAIEDFPVLLQTSDDKEPQDVIKCKICSEAFTNDQVLGTHWMDSHKKEAQWLYRGYVCAICLDSFTNKKVLESHVQQRHHVDFVEHCMLLQCIPCGSHFGHSEELWLHVLSVHPCDLRLPNDTKQQDASSWKKPEPTNPSSIEHMKSENQSDNRRFVCRFCGLKFDLLPDLGRHHQAAHMGQAAASKIAQKLKPSRMNHSRFQKALNSASYRIRNRGVQNSCKRLEESTSVGLMDIPAQSASPLASTLGRLPDFQCSDIAKVLKSEIKKTKSRPSNSELLEIASSACCKVSLQRSLDAKFDTLPERVYLRGARLCSENNVLVDWHQENFVCPKGCQAAEKSPVLLAAMNSSENRPKSRSCTPSHSTASDWTMDECHCVVDSQHFSTDLSEKNIILCDDMSFGQELIPIACVVDENLLNAEGADGQMMNYSFPWESFTYATKSILHHSLFVESESLQLGCNCKPAACSSRTCDHVYLLENDYNDAKDIYGYSMQGRFPYDERGRIILEEGYLVYECNQRCCCSRECQNRVLQNGLQVKLEIFKTEKKGWAVRAREAIYRGTFVCEYIGEVIDEEEANERRKRYGEEGCQYFYEIDARINDMSNLIDGQAPYIIDATNYGNVSRFINHSCSPNLMNHQVLVESMETQLTHIGFYANRDIAAGEELTYNFHYKIVPGEGCPCLCGSSNCRGRLY